MKNSHSSVWGGVDGYPARQLTDSLSQRLNVQPQTFGELKATELHEARARARRRPSPRECCAGSSEQLVARKSQNG